MLYKTKTFVMTTSKYLEAQCVMEKIDSVEKAMEYMETVHCSTECYNAIKDMLSYERQSLIQDFQKI